MRSTWKRMLSAALTIAMIATLLVVPAGAAFVEMNVSDLTAISADTDAGNGFHVKANGKNKLTLETGSKSFPASSDGKIAAFSGTKFLKWSGKSNNKDTDIITYTVSGASESTPVTIRVWMDTTSGGTLNVAGPDGAAWKGVTWTDDVVSGTLKVRSTTVTANGEYHIGFSAGKDTIYKVAVGTAAATYAVNVADATNGTVSVDKTTAAAGDEVTITATPASAEYVVDTITVKGADNSDVTVTDNKFTMPGQAVTVTVTFKANEKTAQQTADEIGAAVEQALQSLTTVAQATVNDSTAAKAAVEAAIAETKGVATAEVAITSITPAVAGDDTKEDGTNGVFAYQIVLTVTKGSDEGTKILTGSVTITATPKTYTVDEVETAISAAKAEMKKYGAGDKAEVFADKIVVEPATMKALTDKIEAAQVAADASPFDAAAAGAAVKALKAAVTTFKTAVEGKTEVGTKTGAEGKVLLAKDVHDIAVADSTNWTKSTSGTNRYESANGHKVTAGTNNAFTFTGKSNGASRVEEATAVFADGYEGTHRINLNGAVSATSANIAFDVKAGSTATIKAWWVSNGADRPLTLAATRPSDAPAAMAGGDNRTNVAKNVSAISTWTVDNSEGTADFQYYLGASNGMYIFRVEVIAQGEKVPVDSITFAHNEHTVYVGGNDVTGGADNTNVKYPSKWKMAPTVNPPEADQTVTWSAASTEFFTVDNEGVVTAVKVGTAPVTATAVGGKTATCSIHVLPYINSVSVSGTGLENGLEVGKTAQLTANVGVKSNAEATAAQKAVQWSTSDSTVATVDQTGKVTAVAEGTVTITATRKAANGYEEDVRGNLTFTVVKATPELTLTCGNSSVTSGAKVRFNLTGVPAGATPTFTVKQGDTVCNDVAVVELTGDAGYNYQIAAVPANTGNASVVYTVTADVEATTATNAATSDPVSFTVLPTGTPNINIKTPGETATVNATAGQSAAVELKVEAVVRVDNADDPTGTAALTYAWTKDGTAVSGSAATLTISAADLATAGTHTYVCTIAGGTTGGKTPAPKTVTFTVKVASSTVALNSVSADLATTGNANVVFDATTKLLTITGKETVVFNVTTDPAQHDETITAEVETVSGAHLVEATYDATAKTLTVVPLRASDPNLGVGGVATPRKVTLKSSGGKTWEMTVLVNKTAAPAVLTVADVAVTAPTAAGGKGTIKINDPKAGTTYRYKTPDAQVWTDMPTTTNDAQVDPGRYMVRIKVEDPTFQNISESLTVVVPDYVPDPVDPVEKDELTAAIAAATEKAEGIYTVADDTKVTEVDRGTKFVTESDKAALQTAIDAAQAVADDADATQDEVDQAVADLAEAVAAFDAAVKTGTKRAGGNTGTTTGTTSGRPSDRPTETETKDDNGNTAKKTTDGKGNTVITVTDPAGEVIAKVELPTTVPSVGYKFIDVPDDHWAAEPINDLAGLGMVKGVNEAEHIYDMTSAVTRGSVATILFRLSQGKDGIAADFSDVTSDAWFADAVGWAAKHGVVTGFENGTFRAEQSITREQLALMLYRYAKLLGMDVKTTGDLSNFVDTSGVSSWAAEAMTWAVGAGIIKGNDVKELNATDAATRAETACMMDRFVALMK